MFVLQEGSLLRLATDQVLHLFLLLRCRLLLVAEVEPVTQLLRSRDGLSTASAGRLTLSAPVFVMTGVIAATAIADGVVAISAGAGADVAEFANVGAAADTDAGAPVDVKAAADAGTASAAIDAAAVELAAATVAAAGVAATGSGAVGAAAWDVLRGASSDGARKMLLPSLQQALPLLQ